jgi:DNA-directed RNA polymerase subunit RPC12/RpoP
MYFVRFFKSGGENYDARQKINAVYKCVSCGHEHWEPDVNPAYLNTQEEKRCPKCGCLNLEDRRINLISKKNSLEAKKIDIDQELIKITAEIEKLERKSS